MELLYYLAVALGFNILMFIPAFLFKTDKLTDLSYSLTFIFIISYIFLKNEVILASILVFSMILLWGLRLGTFLFIRIRNMKKDKRFDGMRESFPRFLKFWLLQGLAVWVILVPALIFLNSGKNEFFLVGLFIWLIGFLFESVADLQKYNFSKKNKAKFISTGLWKYSRHPNYFGEILCWIGIYIFVFPSLNVYEAFFGFISPLFIIFLLLFVSGIPLLEKQADKKFGKDKKYQEYKRKTNVLIPCFFGK